MTQPCMEPSASTFPKLPDLPSELITLALRDLLACESKGRYQICMNFWMVQGRVCGVCLAGAVMAQTCGIEQNIDSPADMPEEIRPKMMALNLFRTGEIRAGLWAMGIRDFKGLPARISIMHYAWDRPVFFHDMYQLAQTFKAAGL